jgi:hypothetical protein
MKGDMCFFNMFKYKINILMTWKVADVGGYDWLKIVDEVDSLHVKRNHLVGWNADEFSPGLVTLVNCVAVVKPCPINAIDLFKYKNGKCKYCCISSMQSVWN